VVRAQREHLLAIEGLWRALAADARSKDREAPTREVEELHRSLKRFDFANSNSFWFLLGLLDDKPAAHLTAARIPKPDGRIGTVYIDELHVLKKHRRRGIGSALLRKAQEIAAGLGLWRLRLNTDPNDTRACSFYEANGFTHGGDGFFEREVASCP